MTLTDTTRDLVEFVQHADEFLDGLAHIEVNVVASAPPTIGVWIVDGWLRHAVGLALSLDPADPEVLVTGAGWRRVVTTWRGLRVVIHAVTP